MAEPRGIRIKRLRLRAMRRGTREMDLILGPFAQAELASMADEDLDRFEALLDQSDPDLYAWISARPADATTGPEALRPLLDRIARFARARWQPGG